MALRAICYTSQLLPGLGWDKLDELVQDAAEFNVTAGVTGLLLFDGSNVLQYFEGPEDGVRIAYSRIVGSTSHMDIVELGRGIVGRRNFPYWSMRALPAEEGEIRGAKKMDWRTFVMRSTVTPDDQLYGIEALARIVTPHLHHPQGQLS